ncbi:MAG: hypothetical protein ACKO34_01725 [Vampirovibrionales bacterium]
MTRLYRVSLFLAFVALFGHSCLAAETATSQPAVTSFQPVGALASQRQKIQIYLPNQLYSDRSNTLTVRNKQQTPLVLTLVLADAYKQLSEPIVLTPSGFNPQTGVATFAIALPPPPKPVNTNDAEATPVKPSQEASLLAGLGWVEARLHAGNLPPSSEVQFMGANGLPLSLKQPYARLSVTSTKSGSGLGVLPSLPGMNPQAVRGVSQLADFATDSEKRDRLMDDGSRNLNRSIDRNTFSLPTVTPLQGF